MRLGIGHFMALLQPDIVVGDTVVQLTPAPLLQRGIAGVVLDIDDTLVPMRRADITPEVVRWLQGMCQHFDIWLVSNNLNTQRIQRIAAAVQLPYIDSAAKPSRRSLRRVLAAMKLPPERVAIVGDRLFTDVLAGNRMGMLTVLIDPVCRVSRPLPWLSERSFFRLWGVKLKKTL
ncbi:MAG: YqeG family HAD IIIA-type phosphatase [Cyanobacteria bacterium J06642_2]